MSTETQAQPSKPGGHDELNLHVSSPIDPHAREFKFPSQEIVGARRLLEDAAALIKAHPSNHGSEITFASGDPDPQLKVNPAEILQVLINLALNAFEAMSANRPDARRLVITGGRNGNGELVFERGEGQARERVIEIEPAREPRF